MSVKKSVGLVLLSTKRGSLTALFQRRAKSDSFPGCLQVSCHGKLEEGEEFNEALWREMAEELGERFTLLFRRSPINLVKAHEIRNDKQEVETWAALVPNDFLGEIEDFNNVHRWVPFRESELDLLIPITPDMKENGAPEGKVAMFADEIEAVRKAFTTVIVPA